jgi:hypothetical protein
MGALGFLSNTTVYLFLSAEPSVVKQGQSFWGDLQIHPEPAAATSRLQD